MKYVRYVKYEEVEKLLKILKERDIYMDWTQPYEKYDGELKKQIEHIERNTIEIEER